MSCSIYNKIKKNIEKDNCILTKEELEQLKNRCLEIKDLIAIESKKGIKANFKEMKKLSLEFADIVKRLKKYEKILKKNS